MKKKMSFIALIIAALVLTGCVHTRTVDLGNAANPSFAAINRMAQKKKATLTLADNRTIAVFRLQVTADSTSWWQHGRWETLPTAEVKEIQFENRSRGALLGTLSGAAFGILISQVAGSKKVKGDCVTREGECTEIWFGFFSCSCTRWSYRDQRNLPYAAGAALGAGIGLFVGSGIKTRDVYRIAASVPAPSRLAEDVEQQRPNRRLHHPIR